MRFQLILFLTFLRLISLSVINGNSLVKVRAPIHYPISLAGVKTTLKSSFSRLRRVRPLRKSSKHIYLYFRLTVFYTSYIPLVSFISMVVYVLTYHRGVLHGLSLNPLEGKRTRHTQESFLEVSNNVIISKRC